MARAPRSAASACSNRPKTCYQNRLIGAMSSLSAEPLRPPASAGKPARSALKRISLLVIGPSMDILGGQAVQVRRLLGILEGVEGLDVTFLPINPRPPRPFLWVLSIRGLRTVVTFAQYIVRLAWTIPQH